MWRASSPTISGARRNQPRMGQAATGEVIQTRIQKSFLERSQARLMFIFRSHSLFPLEPCIASHSKRARLTGLLRAFWDRSRLSFWRGRRGRFSHDAGSGSLLSEVPDALTDVDV